MRIIIKNDILITTHTANLNEKQTIHIWMLQVEINMNDNCNETKYRSVPSE